MSGSPERPITNQYDRRRILVVLGPLSLAIVAIAVAVSDRPLAVTVLVGTASVAGAILVGLRHFEILTLLMIGGRTAIDLAHPGVG